MAITPEQVDAALSAIIDSGAQSYSIGNRSVSKIDPGKLYDLLTKIQSDADRTSSGIFRLARMRPRSQSR